MRRLVLALLCLAATPPAIRADPGAEITPETKKQVIEALCVLLEDVYVIPETAERLEDLLRRQLESGAYDGAGSRGAFAAAVTSDMQDLSHDIHLRLMESAELTAGGPRVVRVAAGDDAPAEGDRPGPPGRVVVRRAEPPGDGDDSGPRRVVREADDGGVFDGVQGIVEAKMLEGNVGYVDIRLFVPLERERDVAVKAMETVAGADALIFDLRTCAGGSPDMVHFVESYLYPPEPKHLLTYFHGHAPPDSAYTLAEVPGRRLPDADVFIATSHFTGSGCEEFTYTLKHHGRATVVGEKTGGAGHGGGVHPVAAGFHAFVPDFRPVHPVTGGGWEAVGVTPHVECGSRNAVLLAHKLALEALVKRGVRSADDVQELIASLDAKLASAESPAPFDPAAAAEYAGTYGIRTIFVEPDGLYLQRQGGPKLRLVPADEPDTFTLEIMQQARIRFGRGDDGTIETLHVLGMTGKWEVTSRQE